MVDSHPNRAANAPNHAYFAASSNTNESTVAGATNGGQAILRDLPINNNLQKSGDIHCKVDR